MFVDSKNINVKSKINVSDETMNIIITSKKTFEKSENIIEETEQIAGDIKEGDIKINIKISMKDVLLDKNKKPKVQEASPGIKLIYLKIIKNQKQKGSTIVINDIKKSSKESSMSQKK